MDKYQVHTHTPHFATKRVSNSRDSSHQLCVVNSPHARASYSLSTFPFFLLLTLLENRETGWRYALSPFTFLHLIRENVKCSLQGERFHNEEQNTARNQLTDDLNTSDFTSPFALTAVVSEPTSLQWTVSSPSGMNRTSWITFLSGSHSTSFKSHFESLSFFSVRCTGRTISHNWSRGRHDKKGTPKPLQFALPLPPHASPFSTLFFQTLEHFRFFFSLVLLTYVCLPIPSSLTFVPLL